MRIQVKDFMTTPVVVVTSKNSVQDVSLLMKSKGISAIPVVKYSQQLPEHEVTIQGIVTSTDVNNVSDDASSVEHIMTEKVHVIHKNSSAKAAAKILLKHSVHHVVVMDEGQIIGMISSLDFVKLVAQHNLE